MSGLCGVCGSTDLSVGGDGFSYCNVCGSQSQFFQDQAFDYDDTHVYNARNVRERAVARKESTQLSQQLLQSQASQLLQTQASQLQATPDDLAYFSQFVENPTPYFSQAVTEVEKEEELPDRVRRVYVEGVQILVQMQCEALVERFGATPMVCGVLGPVWLKFVRSTGVFEKGWAEDALLVAEAQHERGDGEDDDDDEDELLAGPDDKPVVQNVLKPKRKKRVSGEPWTTYGERTRFVYLRSLKARIPLRASLAITFLVCHLAREPILPTDIINWAYEGTLPYLSAYTEIEKRFNNQTSHSHLFKASKIFKPQRMTNARVVEYLASLIGDRIGLQLPPVNFHLISRRFLRELGLPVDTLAPLVCRVFEWFPSSGVWLTNQVNKLPTRVCVMAVLVVVFKVLYKLDGRAGEDEEHEAFLKKVKALLEDDADQVDDQEQLTEYLRYCRETIFANDGMSNDEDLRDHFWELYEQSAKQGALRGTISRESEEVESETGLQLKNTRHKQSKKKSRKPASKLRTDPLLRGMEDLGFFLLDPPKEVPREDEYWTYIITRDDLRPVHEQYLLVLRACAKIIDVDPRAMHLAVLNVEKGIIDAEKKVLKFLAMQQGRSLDEATEEMEQVD